MDQIIIGVDTHKSNHIAVAISRQGARLGVSGGSDPLIYDIPDA